MPFFGGYNIAVEVLPLLAGGLAGVFVGQDKVSVLEDLAGGRLKDRVARFELLDRGLDR